MGILIIIAIVVIWIIIANSGNKPSSGASPSSTASPRPSTSSAVQTKHDPSNVFRPSQNNVTPQKSTIRFKDTSSTNVTPTDLDIKDLVDALTGVPLTLDAGLCQCSNCKVFYQAASFKVIQSENGGRCVSCQHSNVIHIVGHGKQRGRNADVDIITLNNFKGHIGHVITFEGVVHKILQSRRGTDYAVMFENRSWTQGFKMVAFGGNVDQIGGRNFIYSLAGHTVQVRGLLVKHHTFGYEIIVSDRRMILSVK